ncbi:E3 ubiquitin-protein ligase RNF139 isoform X6 [Halichoerus grypus]
MAAVGPPQQQVRMAHQQVWAALEVALRVPCLYIIDAIFNSYYDSSQSRFCIGLQIFLRLLEIGGSLSEENEATQKDPDKLTFRNPW